MSFPCSNCGADVCFGFSHECDETERPIGVHFEPNEYEPSPVDTRTRLYRFDAPIFSNDRRLEVRAASVALPIFGDSSKLLGFASLDSTGLNVIATCSIDPACPERLEMETGARKYWLDANLEYRGFRKYFGDMTPTIVYIRCLYLTAEKIEGRDPVPAGVLI